MSTAKLNATGLCDYPITIHYKQDIQNKVADCLSRSPIEATVQHLVLSTDEIKTILSPVKNQDDHEDVWIAALAVTKHPETDNKEVFSDKIVSSISKDQIQQLQHGEPVVSSVIKLKKLKLKLANKERSAQPANVKKLLRHWARPHRLIYMRNCSVRWDTLAQKVYISWLKRECSGLEWKKT